MRNLKRALSLALAFVMVMSLMIVGTSAKSYTDADKIDNQVAVEILGEIGVMIGNDDGSFAPDRDVTRAEMAVIITRILYGNNMNVDQFKNMNTFTDVPDWAEGFVNLCASLDIIAGRGNGIFDPDATVTSAEAALMLSRALGYFKNNAEFGNDWALAAMKRATQAGIIGGDMVLQANAGLDRDDVAQMTFNTLTKAVPVQYNEVLDVYYNENQGVIYALEFNYLQTLGYKNFSLVYKSNQQVEYGRPATTWGIGSYVATGSGTASGIEKDQLTADGGLIASKVRMLASDEIITVNNTPTYVYTQNTKEKDIYSDLGADVCTEYSWRNKDGYTWTAYVNGKEQDNADVPTKNSSTKYEYTDKGTVTEIYVDDDAATVTVVEINYYLGQVYSVDDGTTTIRSLSPEGKVLDDRTFATEEFADDDYVVFTVDYNDDNDFYICEMMAPETVTGEVVRVDQDKDSDDTYIRLDDDNNDKIYYTNTDTHMAYDVSTGSTSHPDLNEEYILYMTPDGYVLGFELAEEKVPQYLYVTDSSEQLRDWIGKVILPDATEPKVDLDSDLDGTDGYAMADEIHWISPSSEWVENATNIDELIWDYSVNGSDVYSLTYVPQLYVDANEDDALYQAKADGLWINNGEPFVESALHQTAFIVDEDTIFVDTVNGVSYTGYNEVPDVGNAELAYVVEDGVAQIVFILAGNVYDANMIYFFLEDDSSWESKKHDGDYYREYEDSYVDGKNEKLMVAYDALDAAETPLSEGTLYRVSKSFEDGGVRYITEVQVVSVVYPHDEILRIYEPQWVGTNAFSIKGQWLPDDSNLHKYTTNGDTTFVLVEREAKNVKAYEAAMAAGVAYTGGFEWNVIPGKLANMDDNRLANYVQTYVTVPKADGRVAELVYIYQITPDYNGSQYKVTVTSDSSMAGVFQVSGLKTFYNKGENVSLTITPEAGYQITNVTVNGVAATRNADGTWTVKVNNITADAVVNVVAEAIPETYTLTLTAADLLTGSKVYLGDGSGDALTPSKVNTSFGKPTSIEYQIPQNEDVTIVDTDITDGQMSFKMTGDKVIDEAALGLENGTWVTFYVDGKPVLYVEKGDATVPAYNIPATATGTSFKWTYKSTTAYHPNSTSVVLAGMDADMYVETGYVTVTDASSQATGYTTYSGANYMKANGELTIKAPGTYKINDEIVTTKAANEKYTVADKNVTIVKWQTAEQLDTAVETAWDTIIKGGIKGPDKVSNGKMTVDMDTNTINLVSYNNNVISNTGLVDLASSLIATNTIKVQVVGGSTTVTIPQGGNALDYAAALKALLPAGVGSSVQLLVTVTNANGVSVEYTVNYSVIVHA